jgi:hypothetical protein
MMTETVQISFLGSGEFSAGKAARIFNDAIATFQTD